MRRYVSIVYLLAIVLLGSRSAFSFDVDCRSREPEVAEGHADLIFLGRLIREIDDTSVEGRRVFSIAVLRRWKGPPLTKSAKVSIHFEFDFFLPEVSYLFFAKETEDDIWNVIPGPCSGTVHFLNSVADQYLKYLGEPVWEAKAGD